MMKIICLSLLLTFLFTVIAASDNFPQQISLNYGSLPSQMVVMWAVFGAVDGDAECQFGLSPDKLVNTLQ